LLNNNVGMTGRDDLVPTPNGEVNVMPLNEIPKFFHPETRNLIDFAMEDAWQELRKEGLADTPSVRGKLATTIVALAAIGETDPTKLKRFALHAARGALQVGNAARGVQQKRQAGQRVTPA
jgi:hypothetical protein